MPREASPRSYLMCPPDHFRVTYSINPWMDPEKPVDTRLAVAQWEDLRDRYLALGHQVSLLEPRPGLPDMVFAANGATVVGGRVFGARFAHEQRAREADAHLAWFRGNGYTETHEPAHINEGEGDFAVTGTYLLAGRGFRSSTLAHDEAQEFFGRPVIGLDLVDPRYYHLDTALCVLDDAADEIMYYPDAFSPGSRSVLRRLFPDALLASDAGRRRTRAERGERRAACASAAGRGRAVRTAAGTGVRAGRDRSRRTPQGRRQREVLHPGTAPLRNRQLLGRRPGGGVDTTLRGVVPVVGGVGGLLIGRPDVAP